MIILYLRPIFHTMVKQLRKLLFGLNKAEKLKIYLECKEIEEVFKRKRAQMEAIRNSPVPKCDGTYD